VSRPLGSIALGESKLAEYGDNLALRVRAEDAHAVVLANGGNCTSADINWVHYVHHASRFEDAGAPLSVKLKNRWAENIFRRHEKQAIRNAKLVIANSEITRAHVTQWLGIDGARVKTIYLGANAEWEPASSDERGTARAWLNIPPDAPVVAFVGALGHDRRKGFDTLWRAWEQLSVEPAWNAHLVVAGGGRQVEHWRLLSSRYQGRVHVLGFTNRVHDVLAASDLLVSPVLYEPFGLNVMETICRGVPAMVSACAGASELYPENLRRYLLEDPQNHAALAAMLKAWSGEIEHARADFAPMSAQLRSRPWKTMADEIIAAAAQLRAPAAGDILVATQ
jgi:glycosyltransferase involved in cell wall biosynthesis